MTSLLIAMVAFGGGPYTWRALEVAPAIWTQAGDEDPYLLAAMAWVESRWNPRARSKTKDCGLLQTNIRWSKLTCAELMSTYVSVKTAAGSIRYWRKRFGKDWLCHYNSGNQCWRRSRAYAAKVLRTMGKIRRMVK